MILDPVVSLSKQDPVDNLNVNLGRFLKKKMYPYILWDKYSFYMLYLKVRYEYYE